MKISGSMAVAVVAAALALQGCAGGGDIKYAPGAQPSSTPQKASSPAVTAVNDKSDFDAVHAAVKQQMQPGKRWGFIDPTDRGTVDQRFADMQALFDKYGTVDKMDGLAKTRLLDDQNAINEALARNDGNRLICQRVAPTGSHITKTVCMTLSEMRLRERNDKFNLNQQQLQGMTQKIGGG
ncbi:MAG: hypothetical protein KGJ94_04875 [Xanthomonadaceae bacterium]|nr:hypothetical protein [Xanthomonadaceae bacterium]